MLSTQNLTAPTAGLVQMKKTNFEKRTRAKRRIKNRDNGDGRALSGAATLLFIDTFKIITR